MTLKPHSGLVWMPAELLWQIAECPEPPIGAELADSLHRCGWLYSDPAELNINAGGAQEVHGRHRLWWFVKSGLGKRRVPVRVRYFPRRRL